MNTLIKYWVIWKTTVFLSVQSTLENRLAVVFFTLGKLTRFTFFIGFIVLIGSRVPSVRGYNSEQIILFFLIFNLFDLFGQFFYRGIYFFREQVVSGELDFRLTKPINPLFQVLTRHTDILDLPLIIVVVFSLFTYNFHLSLAQFIVVSTLFLCGFLLVSAIHICIAGLGIITTEVDNTIMIYRDLSNLARFPIDIYPQFVRGFLTYIIPVAIAYTVPAKSLLGLVGPATVLISVSITLIFMFISLRFWRFALTQYSSASS
jgi:ABC-2 type transport system permease protein